MICTYELLKGLPFPVFRKVLKKPHHFVGWICNGLADYWYNIYDCIARILQAMVFKIKMR